MLIIRAQLSLKSVLDDNNNWRQSEAGVYMSSDHPSNVKHQTSNITKCAIPYGSHQQVLRQKAERFAKLNLS